MRATFFARPVLTWTAFSAIVPLALLQAVVDTYRLDLHRLLGLPAAAAACTHTDLRSREVLVVRRSTCRHPCLPP